MSKRQYGTLHSMNPSWKEQPDGLVAAVVNDYRHGRSMLDLARELWRLAGNDAWIVQPSILECDAPA
jgi:hypothetical protein